MSGIEKQGHTDLISIEHYKNIKKSSKTLKPRAWCTRKVPFETVWKSIKIQLEINPALTSKEILVQLIKEEPEHFSQKQLRSLQRRVADWRAVQLQLVREHQIKLMTDGPSIEK